MGRNDFSVFTFCSCTSMGSKKWLCLSVIHFCIFPPPALLWKGRYDPSWCTQLPSWQNKISEIFTISYASFSQVPRFESLALIYKRLMSLHVATIHRLVGSKKWLCYSPLHFSTAGSTLEKVVMHCTALRYLPSLPSCQNKISEIS